MRSFAVILATLSCLIVLQSAEAGMLGRLMGKRGGGDNDLSEGRSEESLPAGVRLLSDIAYGDHEKQKMDVYIPENTPHNAPVIFMVHGGAWFIGDKHNKGVWSSKVERWVPKGFVFISVNYRMLHDDADPLQQAEDIKKALAFAQSKAGSWGGNPAKFILMGHSAGAHLIALITSDYANTLHAGVKPWLGSIFLDSGALNVTPIMEKKHLWFYNDAFGQDPEFWKATSPTVVLSGRTPPVLAVCSTKHANSCDQSQEYMEKSRSLGNEVRLLQEQMNHGAISGMLGKNNSYNADVEAFMASLDPQVKSRLE